MDTYKNTSSSVVVQVKPVGSESISSSNPIHVWAFIGGSILAVQLFVVVKWIIGPYFTPVLPGPSDPPLAMKIALMFLNTFFIIAFIFCAYFFFIKPWREERRITTDGMLMASFTLLWFYDPLLNYFNTWCVYNAWLFNMGSWVQDVPGWVSWGRPGQMMLEPLIIVGGGYACGIILSTIMGCWVMRRVKARWPNISTLGLLGVLFVFIYIFDVVMEGVILMPMGLYAYPGAIRWLCIFPGRYYQYPIYEGLMWGTAQSAFCALRYFKDDHGRTFVERGLERIEGGVVRQQSIRFLAIFAICNIIYVLFFTIPANWFGMHPYPWPEDVKKRSYFTMGICGEGTGRFCPDPSLPFQTNISAYIDSDGAVALPEGTKLPTVIPYEVPEGAELSKITSYPN